MRKMRLLPPRRTSEIDRTGAAHSWRATSWMSSGAAEECVTDLVPGSILLELTLRIAAEQDLATGHRHLRMAKHLGEVVDEYVAFKRAYAADLFVAGPLEIDILSS